MSSFLPILSILLKARINIQNTYIQYTEEKKLGPHEKMKTLIMAPGKSKSILTKNTKDKIFGGNVDFVVNLQLPSTEVT